jgi:hypothetical protein
LVLEIYQYQTHRNYFKFNRSRTAANLHSQRNYRLNNCQRLFTGTAILQNPHRIDSHQFNSSWYHDRQPTPKLEQTERRTSHVQPFWNVGTLSAPKDNPIAAKYGKQSYPWTSEIKWSCTYNIQDFQGGTIADRFNFARDIAAANGGGVIYFPAGTYEFPDSIYLKSGTVIRGATPDTTNAKQNDYKPPTKFVFPKYQPKLLGTGTPNSTAFKRIFTYDPNNDSNIGIVNLDINRSPVYFTSNLDYSQNRNIVVFGIRSNNVAEPISFVPNLNFQAAWQRYANPYAANIKINALANVLIANNRLNDRITDNYQQPEYQVKLEEEGAIDKYDIRFDYSNHFGILVNRSKAGKFEENFVPAASPIAEPGLFRKGIVIRDNWVYHTMRAGIRASGNGLVIRDNVKRILAF